MSFGSSGSPPPVPSPVPAERVFEGIDRARELEAERIRRMRGRLSTFLTKGLIMGEPGTQSGKLGV